MRIGLLTLIFSLLIQLSLHATEGMWIPLLLSQLNEAEMQSMGMKMTAEDVYSVNKGSLKDAIVHFGGFCTGEVISASGLVLTNHHCGYGQIQRHSTLAHNYLEEGFWAENHAAELPNPGLFVTFIKRIEDVSEKLLSGISPELDAVKRQSLIDQRIAELKQNYSLGPFQDVIIRPFYHGNQYFLFLTETYKDVRLVGAPPSSIGKFGADTDNWEWPRHTGDFALFRIYASPDNKPAEYAPDNVPYTPVHHLPISLDGVAPQDFTLVFGFPGRTDQYLPAIAMDQRVNTINPIRIGIRDRSLAILDQAMRHNPEDRIRYASKQARIANSWKKWKGESQGVRATNGLERKKQLEMEFMKKVEAEPRWHKAYGSILRGFDHLYRQLEPLAISRNYVIETFWYNIELFQLVNRLRRLTEQVKSTDSAVRENALARIQSTMESFYKDYNAEVDQQIAAAVLPLYYDGVQEAHLPPYAKDEVEFSGGKLNLLVQALYDKSFLTKPKVAQKILTETPLGFVEQLEGDYAFQYVDAIMSFSEEKIFSPYNKINEQINDLQRRYMEGLMTVFADRRFYPDANGTMRVSYGKVEGYSVGDSLHYDYQTYLSGVIAKYRPGDYEFDVPDRLLELYKEKDYGLYATADGRLPVCFLGSNHTTGGNSGSPAIDAHGNLVGLNFDRTWHGTMSDINYDPRICRNIMVDARYILFIIDKFAGADHLIKEMSLVHPKK
ncbi:MAG: S46 family peptidase [Bacteroidetes bacterium]|nr:MAG: S46 family peptidase [Bacteroidota bacterium]